MVSQARRSPRLARSTSSDSSSGRSTTTGPTPPSGLGFRNRAAAGGVEATSTKGALDEALDACGDRRRAARAGNRSGQGTFGGLDLWPGLQQDAEAAGGRRLLEHGARSPDL